jgi:hypothetical protein
MSPSISPNGGPGSSSSETDPLATTVPTSSARSLPSPTEPGVDPATVFAANGIGPYVVGARLTNLESRNLVANVEPSFHCDDDWQNAAATGSYADKVTLSFHLDRLIHAHTNSPELVTPSGARVGMALTELQRIYGTRGTLITGVSGNQAVSVRVPDTTTGIVFFLDSANASVASMSAGEVRPLEELAINGEGC